jgi:hypothetical protein
MTSRRSGQEAELETGQPAVRSGQRPDLSACRLLLRGIHRARPRDRGQRSPSGFARRGAALPGKPSVRDGARTESTARSLAVYPHDEDALVILRAGVQATGRISGRDEWSGAFANSETRSDTLAISISFVLSETQPAPLPVFCRISVGSINRAKPGSPAGGRAAVMWYRFSANFPCAAPPLPNDAGAVALDDGFDLPGVHHGRVSRCGHG